MTHSGRCRYISHDPQTNHQELKDIFKEAYLTVLVLRCEVYIIFHDRIRINLKQFGHLIRFERDEGASTWKNLVVAICIYLVEKTRKVLEDTCLKMV